MTEIDARHAGQSYPARAGVFRRRVEAALAAADPAGVPDGEAPFLITPHIDLRVDAACYAAAYRALAARRAFPEVVFILGVGHRAESEFSVHPSAWTTPLGRVVSALDVCGELEAAVPAAFTREAEAYPGEHSIEFALVWLQAVRDLAFPGAPFAVVPVLCGGLWDSVLRGRPPAGRSEFARFGRRLARVVERLGTRAAVVVSIDGCHVGPRFDHPFPAGEPVQRAVKSWERELWSHCRADGMPEFFRHLAAVGNGFYFDGVGALALATHYCHRDAVVLRQRLWYEPRDASFVTFSGGVLRPAAGEGTENGAWFSRSKL